MNLIEKKEKEATLNKLKEDKKNKLSELKVTEDVEKAQAIDNELKEFDLDIIKLENELKNSHEEDKKMKNNYVGSKQEVKDFVEALQNSKNAEEASNKWGKTLANNGITVTDPDNYLPKKIVEAINTSLTETNPVFPLFRITNVGALIVSQTFGSTDEALVHTPGTTKTEQAATLEIDSLKPVMIYKLQSIHEYVRRTVGTIDEIVDLIIAELTQAIVNKIVDLALVEGDGSTNGFQAIQKDTREKFVHHVNEPDSFVEGVEEAVNFVRRSAGATYLIVTEAQRSALLAEIRKLNPNVRVKNDDAEIASEVGADGVIIYRGTKALKPIVLAQDGVHVDMDDMTQIRVFKWETNENKFLVEVVAGGHVDKMYSASYITLAAPAAG